MKEKKLNDVQKLHNVFFYTTKFFEYVKHEKTIKDSWLFFVKVSIIYLVLNTILTYSQSVDVFNKMQIPVGVGMVASFILSLILVFVSPFIFAGITHLGVLIFKGENGFLNTFKPVTYGATVGFVYGVISLIIVSIIRLLIPYNADLVMSKMAMSGSVQWGLLLYPIITGAISLIIGLIGIVHSLYAETTGLAKFQDMTKGKAFLSIIIIPLIIFGVFLLIFLFILMIVLLASIGH